MSEDTLFRMVQLVLLLPLASTVLLSFIPFRYRWLAPITVTLLLALTVIFTFLVFANVWNYEPKIWQTVWFTLNHQSITLGIFLNNTSLIMLLIISVISFFVHFYSVGYMASDKGEVRYFSVLGFFTFAMFGLVLADTLLLLFVFWELVGFSSYLLIGHWREKPAAARAAKKAFLINRVGDLGLLVGLLIVWTNTGTLDLTSFTFSGVETWRSAASLCILLGVISKSAQFPLFVWLPDAMEGPTPVSALIHAATMVAAGVFLLVRVFPIFTPDVLDITVIVGTITTLLAALVALKQTDVKKILAYSTISQLGLMVVALGTGAYGVALLHLFTHAFFKAGLFLSTGAVLHAIDHTQQNKTDSFDTQDIRNLGGLRKAMPVTFVCFVVFSAALIGLPFFSGFQSKDAILVGMYEWSEGSWRSMLFWIVVVASVVTTFYTVRMLWFVFLAPAKETKSLAIHEAPLVMRVPLLLLAAASFWIFVNPNPIEYSGWLLKGMQPIVGQNTTITWFSFLCIPVCALLAWAWYRKREVAVTNTLRFSPLLHAFYVDAFVSKFIVRTGFYFSTVIEKTDRQMIDSAIHIVTYTHVTFAHFIGWMDRILVDGSVDTVGRLAKLTGSVARSFSGGKIQTYIFWSVFALILFLFWVLL
jgi:NADH-quinone oxidoreductase subunit L